MEFCKVSEDVDLASYGSVEEMLNAEFFPGNYDPTREQATQLIRCAVASAIRWHEIKGQIADLNSELKEALDGWDGVVGGSA